MYSLMLLSLSVAFNCSEERKNEAAIVQLRRGVFLLSIDRNVWMTDEKEQAMDSLLKYQRMSPCQLRSVYLFLWLSVCLSLPLPLCLVVFRVVEEREREKKDEQNEKGEHMK